MAQVTTLIGQRVGTFSDGNYAVLDELTLQSMIRDTVTAANNLNVFRYVFRKESSVVPGAFFTEVFAGTTSVLADPYPTPSDAFMNACDEESITPTI